jgi:IS605 OrfB family transposase
MNPGMPKGAAPKLFLGVHARLVFLKEGDERAVLDLMRRFSGAVRFAYRRLLEGQDRKELKREDGPLCTLFGLNTRYADGAIEKAQATLDSARELGQDPRKVVFGGRKLFEQLKRKHLSGKALLALKREWKERRQGLLYSRGDATKKGNANLRLEPGDGALWLRVNLGNGAYVRALVQTSHPQLKALLQRAYASLPYNVTIRFKDGKVYAHFTWSEGLPPPVHTKANGVLGIDANGDPYHLALAVVSPDGNLIRHLTLSLEEVDRVPNKGAKELLLWKVAHQVVALAEEHGVAIATEKLKYLRKSRRGDGSGRHFRRNQHRFAYRSLLEKIHSLARKAGRGGPGGEPPGHLHDRHAQVRPPASPLQGRGRCPRDREKGSGVRREGPQGLPGPPPKQKLLRVHRGVLPKPSPGTPKAQRGRGEPLPQAEAFPGHWEGQGRPDPRLKPSGLAGEPEGGNQGKEPLRRPSLAGPEGRSLPSPSRARGAKRSFAPQARPFGIVGEVEKRPRPSSWWGVGVQKCALWLTRNESALHWDLVLSLKEGRLLLDGEPLMVEGRFV